MEAAPTTNGNNKNDTINNIVGNVTVNGSGQGNNYELNKDCDPAYGNNDDEKNVNNEAEETDDNEEGKEVEEIEEEEEGKEALIPLMVR